MAQFRTLGREDVERILAAYGIPISSYRAHHPISAGTINTNVRVELADGPRFVRVNEGKTIADVAREAAIAAHLAERGVPTPVPMATAMGKPFFDWGGHLVSMFPWLPGRVLSRPEVTDAQAASVGAALGKLHLAGQSFGDHSTGRYESDEIDRRVNRIAAAGAADPTVADAVALLRPELADLTRRRATDVPLGVIHGDLFIDNVLFEGEDLVALIDFEQASWGRLAYDVAVTLLAFAFGRDDFEPGRTRALLAAYAGVRSPTPGERAGFGDELRFAACRFAVTRITDVHMKRTEGAPGGKDFRRYLQRLACVKRHIAAGDGLLALP